MTLAAFALNLAALGAVWCAVLAAVLFSRTRDPDIAVGGFCSLLLSGLLFWRDYL